MSSSTRRSSPRSGPSSSRAWETRCCSPPLVLLIFIYFGFPFLQIDLPKLAAVALGFFLNTSSYYGEVFRAGIESIPRGQMNAALSMGLTRRQAYRHVIVP